MALNDIIVILNFVKICQMDLTVEIGDIETDGQPLAVML